MRSGLLETKLFNDSGIIILIDVFLIIYHFNENGKFISLSYFCYFKAFYAIEKIIKLL
jgi:hypothetical protein